MSGGEKRIFNITPSRFQYTKFKDDLHFYVTLAVIPLGLLILYCNIFIGQATLSEIPEGYEPKNYEYYRVSINLLFLLLFTHKFIANYVTLCEFDLYNYHTMKDVTFLWVSVFLLFC